MLVFDDPTAAIDAATERRIRDALLITADRAVTSPPTARC